QAEPSGNADESKLLQWRTACRFVDAMPKTKGPAAKAHRCGKLPKRSFILMARFPSNGIRAAGPVIRRTVINPRRKWQYRGVGDESLSAQEVLHHFARGKTTAAKTGRPKAGFTKGSIR